MILLWCVSGGLVMTIAVRWGLEVLLQWRESQRRQRKVVQAMLRELA